MLQSMTGYGKATGAYNDRQIRIEIKSLNSKQMDISARIPTHYREKEIDLRRIIANRLERGKVDFLITVNSVLPAASARVNESVITDYYMQLSALAEKERIPAPSDWFASLLRLPDVLKTEEQDMAEEEWEIVQQTTEQAVEELVKFRIQEGNTLQKFFTVKIDNIETHLQEVPKYEMERLEGIKNRLREGLQSLNENYNADRFEQELIYYIEKLDINEEKSRLQHHLDYFRKTMQTEHNPGKKLGFISQEIGREINTMGSKANHSELQKWVVLMKDELEQIKEQVLNVL